MNPRFANMGRRAHKITPKRSHEFDISLRNFDLPLCVTSGQVFRWERGEDREWMGVDGEDWYRVQLRSDSLLVRSNSDASGFRKLFGLGENFDLLKGRLLARGPELAPFIEILPGLRLMQPSEPSEVFFCFLCTANNHLARIHGMARVLASYGEPLAEVEGRSLMRFPTAERIARIPEAELRANGFGYRAKSIPLAAAAVAERGPKWFSHLAALPFTDAREALMEIPSVGPKLADCIALYGLHKSEATPFDTHLWQAYCRVYQPALIGENLTRRRYEEASMFFRERFGDLAGLAHLILYRENQINWRSRQ